MQKKIICPCCHSISSFDESMVFTTESMKSITIDINKFTARTCNILHCEKIVTYGELISRTEKDLMKIPNFGRKSLYELREHLQIYGLSLKD